MQIRPRGSLPVAVAFMVAASLPLALATAQTSAYTAPRTTEGRPDLNGIWQVLNTANWDIQGHAAGAEPLPRRFFCNARMGECDEKDQHHTGLFGGMLLRSF